VTGIGSRALDVADKRALLLDAAERVFGRAGYAHATIAAIAAEAGVTRPTVYAYFQSRDEVFHSLAERVRDEVLQLQEEADTSSPVAIARSTLTALLDVFVRHHGMLTIIAHQAISDPRARTLHDDIYGRTNRRHARFLDRMAALGHADLAVPASLLAEAIIGTVGRFADLVTAAPDRQERLARDLVSLYLRLTGLHM
jgi:AcrR family transcriptional regulator